jgi:hypothetical protein
VGRMNLDGPPSCGVKPQVPLTATGKNEGVQLLIPVQNGKMQVTISRNVRNRANKLPHG